jgi:hypothetical protein
MERTYVLKNVRNATNAIVELIPVRTTAFDSLIITARLPEYIHPHLTFLRNSLPVPRVL